jgi:tetratricopeptide (TPR) repeat protein
MIKANPVGYGPGTYRFESGRSGLHTQTVYTHNAFLQLAVESSPLAPLLLLLAGALWTRLAFRGWRTLPNDRRYLQASVFCSVVAVAAHSVVDSDLYYFGIGLTFFTLLGLGLLLSADAVAPEFAPRSARSVGIAGGALAFLLLGYTGIAELWRAQARGQLAVRDAQGAAATLASLRSLAPQDGEAWYYTAQVAPTSSERLEALQRAAALAPTTRNLRALARLQSEAGQLPTAITTTRTALMRDPNNLPALTLLADLQRRSGDAVAANETLRRLVAVEQTPYFQVRSLPELVPTETYMARLTLAQTATGATKAALLQPAVDGLTQYLQRTVPMVKRMAAGTPPMDFGGETPERAREKLAVGERAARELAATYRALGDTGRAEAAEGAAGAFAAGFDK